MRCILVLWLLALIPACSDADGNGKGCLAGPYRCLSASGDCVLATDDQGQVTVTWESGASVVGPMGLPTFTASNPDGETCFMRSTDGSQIVISDGSKTWRVDRGVDGSTTVTCPNGDIESYGPDEFPSSAPGIDPDVFIGCRVQGMCNTDADCEPGQVCCDHECHTGTLCPGACLEDTDCDAGYRCCDGWCTSLPYCNIPCMTDSQCDDGEYCNGQEECNSNRCRPVSPVSCDDEVVCTVDTCDEQRDRCDYRPDDQRCGPDQMCDVEQGCIDVIRCSQDPDCDDQNPCTTDTCQNGICGFEPVSGCCIENRDCADGEYCNGEEICTDNVCGPGQPPDCADEHECTTDHCDAGRNECVHLPKSELCPQGEICDIVEGCTDPNQCADDVYEENDGWQEATQVQSEMFLMAAICPLDQDWYVLDAPAGGGIAAVLKFDPDRCGMDMTLFDETLTEVGQKDTGTADVIFITYNPVPVGQKLYFQVLGLDSSINEYGFVSVVEPP